MESGNEKFMIKLKDLLLLLKENDVAQIKPKYSAVANWTKIDQLIILKGTVQNI